MKLKWPKDKGGNFPGSQETAWRIYAGHPCKLWMYYKAKSAMGIWKNRNISFKRYSKRRRVGGYVVRKMCSSRFILYMNRYSILINSHAQHMIPPPVST
jgi:hypothetical protein